MLEGAWSHTVKWSIHQVFGRIYRHKDFTCTICIDTILDKG